MEIRSKILSGILSAALLVGMLSGAALAKTDTNLNGTYTGTVSVTTSTEDSYTDFFASDVTVVVSNAATTVSIYSVYATLANSDFPSWYYMNGASVSSATLTYDEEEYSATIDNTTLPEKYYTKDSETKDVVTALGFTTGTYQSQILSFELPAKAIDDLENAELSLDVLRAYYALGNATTSDAFTLTISNLEIEVNSSSTGSMLIKANVAEQKSASDYSVTIPESITFEDELSAETDNTMEYEITVEAANLEEEDYIRVTTDASGTMSDDLSNTLVFGNSLDKNVITADSLDEDGTATITGTITITADTVADAEAGNYTGTASFSISSSVVLED